MKKTSYVRTTAHLIVVACAFLYNAEIQSQPVNFLFSEMLGRPTDRSITINMMADTEVDIYVEYGTTSGIYPYKTNSQRFPGYIPIEIVIQGLEQNTGYFYQVRYKPSIIDSYEGLGEHRFHTQRSRNSSFTFTVQADPHLDEQSDTVVYGTCLNNQLTDSPDFMVDLGDIFMSDKLSRPITRDSIDYRHRYLRRFYDKICHSVPLFIALGNHEGEAMFYAGSDSNNVAVWGTKLRKLYYPNPIPDGFYTGDTTIHRYVGQRENYYAFEWGDALFVVIDPYWYTTIKPTNRDSNSNWNWTLGTVQYDWLRRTLEGSQSTFKFIFSHQLVGGVSEGRGGIEAAPFYEWGGLNNDKSEGFSSHRPGWYKPIHQLLVENKVTIFFHGHDHFYAQQELDGVIYQLVPQPSHPQYKNASNDTAYGYLNGVVIPNSGHLKVTVSASNVRVDYVRAYKPANEGNGRKNRDISATYTISANASSAIIEPLIWKRPYDKEVSFPNPFSTHAIIQFSLLESDNYGVNIYDMNGILVRSLLPERFIELGEFSTVWDGRDNQGNSLPSGVYFYSIIHENLPLDQHKIILSRQ